MRNKKLSNETRCEYYYSCRAIHNGGLFSAIIYMQPLVSLLLISISCQKSTNRCLDFRLCFCLFLWYILHRKGEPPLKCSIVSNTLEILPFFAKSCSKALPGLQDLGYLLSICQKLEYKKAFYGNQEIQKTSRCQP